jgi:6-phosphogluconolactonase (cycloisomerase 2 family)
VATNNYVYVASTADQIAVFSINQSTGALTQLSCGPCTSIAAGSVPENLVLDPTGTLLYVGLANSHQIGVGTIATTGPNAGALLGFTIAYTGPSTFMPQDLAMTPGGNILYASNFIGSNTVSAFSVSGTTVTLGSTTPTGAGPNGLAVDPAGRFLYVANHDGSVSAFTIGVGGALTVIPGPFTAGTAPYGATIDPTGNFLYISNFGDNTVSGFRISATGALTSVGAAVSTGTGPSYLLAHLAPGGGASASVPATSPLSLAVLGILLAGMAGLLYRKAYR